MIFFFVKDFVLDLNEVDIFSQLEFSPVKAW